MSFTNDIEKFVNKAEKEATIITKKAIIGLCGDIISDTPVDTGRLKNNWFPSISKPSTSKTDNTTNEASLRNAQFVSKVFKMGDTFYFTNNMPYAYRIEFEGYSKVKAPRGMVRKNIIKWRTYFVKS